MTSPSAITAAAVERISSARKRTDLDHHAERLAEQEIADQHACLVAPDHARGRLAAAQFAFVHHIVMQQRRGVHEFDGGREIDMAGAAISGEHGGRQRQHRPQALAARRDQVVRDLRNHGHFRAGAAQNQFVDLSEVGTNQAAQAFDRGFWRLEGQDDGHAINTPFAAFYERTLPLATRHGVAAFHRHALAA
jgi:hypothetical protein